MSGGEQPPDPADTAAEYVLGTLPADERAAFERAMAGDLALRQAVRAWERWFERLNEHFAESAPDPQSWARIAQAIGIAGPVAGAPRADNVVPLRRSRARWRAFAIAATTIAACLALYIGTGPRGVPGTSYLAVVNRGGDLPALVVEVNTKSETIRVRALAAETPSNRALQLWYIAATGGAPRSLGLVGSGVQTASFPQIGRADLVGGTVAVSVEPVGGSPTGGPTGPVVYSGKLIAE